MKGTFGWWLLLVTAIAGCNRSSLERARPAQLSVSPPRLDFGLVWVGQPQTLQVIVSNEGELKGQPEISISGPFTVDAASLTVPAGARATLTVRYDPPAAGHDSGALHVGTLTVPVKADAKVIPSCPAGPCEVAGFDTLSRSCTLAWKPDGTPCGTACVTGTCQKGECLGSFDACDDANACTADACAEPGGCGHVAIACPPPADPCQVAACDPAQGCGFAAAPDGTACGENLCTASTLEICVQGQCVQRPRPQGTRCGDTWVPGSMVARFGFSTAYDTDRGRLVLFGGQAGVALDETWEWDGASWTQLHPAHAPSARTYASMTYDPVRHVTVLFGGDQNNAETWTWDGADWTMRSPAHSPPGRNDAPFSFDTGRGVAVLFGGVINGYYSLMNDTWEWDGADWTSPSVSAAPSPRQGKMMAYDPKRKRTVLFAGYNESSSYLDDTWEWDGAQWLSVSTTAAPSAGYFHPLVYDPVRQSILAVGIGPGSTTDIWEYDGTNWSKVSADATPAARGGSGIAWDAPRSQLVMFGGEVDTGETTETWVWDGLGWSLASAPTPRPTWGAQMAYDSARQRSVLFVDEGIYLQPARPASTWEWDGTRWLRQSPAASPSSRAYSALAYDSARAVTVLFGGKPDIVAGTTSALPSYDETWEYDGTTWTQRFPAHSPGPRYAASMAYDSVRHRMVLFGGGNDTSLTPWDDTWAWDGNDWSQLVTPVAPAPRGFAGLAFDEATGELVLLGGVDDTVSPGIGSTLGDCWRFDGTQWQQVPQGAGPAWMVAPSIAYDSKRGTLIAYAVGYGGGTWEWNGAQWSLRQPAATPSSEPEGAAFAYDAARDEFVMFGGGRFEGYATSDTWRYIPP